MGWGTDLSRRLGGEGGVGAGWAFRQRLDRCKGWDLRGAPKECSKYPGHLEGGPQEHLYEGDILLPHGTVIWKPTFPKAEVGPWPNPACDSAPGQPGGGQRLC